MSTDTTDTTDEAPADEEPQELSFEEGREQNIKYSDTAKEYIAELPEGGVWKFEYTMIDNDEKLMVDNTTVRKTRSGTVEDTDLESFAIDAFCEGVVNAPDGFPVSKTKIKQQDKLTKKIVKEVGKEVLNFSTADDETIEQFH